MKMIESADKAKAIVKDKIRKREMNVKDNPFVNINIKTISKENTIDNETANAVKPIIKQKSNILKQHPWKLGIGALAVGTGLASYLALRKKNVEEE